MMSIYTGYWVLLSTFTLKFVAIGAFNTSGLYLGPLAESFPSASKGTLALYCTIQIVAGLASSFAGGIAQDYLEKRELSLQWQFAGGGAFMTLGFLWTTLSYNLYNVMIGALLMGVGLGLGGFMASGICVLWFEKKRGTMLLLAMAAEGVGSIFFARATAALLQHFDDEEDPWRSTMRWNGMLCFVLCGISSISMRLPLPGEVEKYEKGLESKEGVALLEAPSPVKRSQSEGVPPNVQTKDVHIIDTRRIRQSIIEHNKSWRQSSIEYMAMGEAMSDTHNLTDFHVRKVAKKRWKNAVDSIKALNRITNNLTRNESQTSLGDLSDGALESYTLGELLLSRTNVLLNSFLVVVCFSVLILQVFLPPYITTLGIGDQDLAGHVLSMIGVGSLLSNLSLGPVADRIGAQRLFIFAFLCIAALQFIWPYSSITGLSVIGFLFGYFVTTLSSLPIIILAEAYSNSPEHILALSGVSSMTRFPGYMLGPVIAGILVEWSGGYNLTSICAGLTTLIGTILLFFIPTPEEQQRMLTERYGK